MIVGELATCRVPANPASPALMVGYVAVCSAFYKRGFGALPHGFLRSLLQLYGLELHHLTPLGIRHIAAFVTLCEAYMGIEPHFNLWNYLFRVRLWPDSNMEAAVWGCVEIYVCIMLGINPYFCLSVSNPSVGWWKEWFFLMNNASEPLPVVTGKHPPSSLAGGMGWLRKIPASYKLCEASSRVCFEKG
jgi:hypothetical protein